MAIVKSTAAETLSRSLDRKDGTRFANVAFKTALFPSSDDQRHLIEQSFGTARFAFNWGLQEWGQRYKRQEKNSFEALRKSLNAIKRISFPWMLNVPKDVPAEALRDLATAFKNFFASQTGRRRGARMGYPQVKKKGRCRFSFRLPADRLRFDGEGGTIQRVYLSTIGWVTLAEPLEIMGRVVSATVSRSGSRYFISFCMEYEVKKRVKRLRLDKLKSIGIDLGLNRTLTLSSGREIQGPRSYRKRQDKIGKVSRALHRKLKGSKNRLKQRQKLARLHQKVADIRRDFIEKTTTQLCRQYQVVVLEDLNVKGMIKNRRLAKSLSDAALGSIVTTVERKASRFGVKVVKVGRFFPSSKQCRLCGVKNQDLTLSERWFRCLGCGHNEDRDIHAAKCLHQEGLRLIPRATGNFMSVEICPLPPGSQDLQGKLGLRSRKLEPRGGAMSNTAEQHNFNSEHGNVQVC